MFCGYTEMKLILQLFTHSIEYESRKHIQLVWLFHYINVANRLLAPSQVSMEQIIGKQTTKLKSKRLEYIKGLSLPIYGSHSFLIKSTNIPHHMNPRAGE